MLALIKDRPMQLCTVFMRQLFIGRYLPSEVQADVVLKNQGVGELAWAQGAGVQGTGVCWPGSVGGQVGPQAALCRERAAAQLTREGTLSQMGCLVQAQGSGAAEDT